MLELEAFLIKLLPQATASAYRITLAVAVV